MNQARSIGNERKNEVEMGLRRVFKKRERKKGAWLEII